jgi:limonene-1,2-epoxide hydrolase
MTEDMTETETIELARAYLALSNAHRVDLIQSLFAADAVYSSSAVGEYQGPAAIAEMMRAFFARYPDVRWQCENYRCTSNRVSFDFELRASDAQSGEQLRRSGIETIEYNADGRIERLDVKAAENRAS